MRFLLRFRSKVRNPKEGTILIRITINGKRAVDFSTGISAMRADWDAKKQRIRGNGQKVFDDNLVLETKRSEAVRLHLSHPDYSAQHVADIMQKKVQTTYSLLDLVNRFKEHVVDSYTNKGTRKNYQTRIGNIEAFIEEKGWKTLSADRINLGHIDDFVRWMKKKNRDQNYIVRHTEIWKNITADAVRRDILKVDPLASFVLKKHGRVNTNHLTNKQLREMETKIWRPVVQRVADLFLFSVYTGLHYEDAQTLGPTDVREGIDGRLWLAKYRGKYADSQFFVGEMIQTVPLNNKALALINKYGGVEKLPKMSNKHYNDTLKQIAFQLDVSFKLSVKIARKTFTDIMLNELHITEEAVAAMLGHTSTKHVKHYGRSDERRIAAELTEAKW